MVTDDQKNQCLLSGGSIVVFSGAGISTESGIPDFRGPSGTWTLDPTAQRMSTLADYVSDPAVRVRAWQQRLTSPIWDAIPNPAHAAIVQCEARGMLAGVITQNIDGLHQAAGLASSKVVELHGSLHKSRCLTCAERRPMREILNRVQMGENDPRCQAKPGVDPKECGGILKSDTVSFGEALDPEALRSARALVQNAAVMVVAGSSLTVHPAAGLVPFAKRHGLHIVICNTQVTPYDSLADKVFHASISDVLPSLLDNLQR